MSAIARAETVDQRSRTFAALNFRNRFVDIMRIAVPVLGILMLSGLVLRLYLGSLVEDFGFADISIDRNSLVVAAPTYDGVGEDGTRYAVRAESARMALDTTDFISLVGAELTARRLDGAAMSAFADAAELSTIAQQLEVAGAVRVSDSEGSAGTLEGVLVDLPSETLTTSGPVDLSFAGGARIEADTLRYDGKARTWRFERVRLTLPGTPGSATLPRLLSGTEAAP